MAKVYVFVAEGNEEIENLTTCDVLNRGGNDVKMISITGDVNLTGSNGFGIRADAVFEEGAYEDGDCFIIPGGMPGTNNLGDFAPLTSLLKRKFEEGKHVAAICAAPMVLGDLGIVNGKKAICYPGCEGRLTGAEITDVPAVTDGNVTTGRGPGAAMDFGLELVRVLNGAEKAAEVKAGLVYPYGPY